MHNVGDDAEAWSRGDARLDQRQGAGRRSPGGWAASWAQRKRKEDQQSQWDRQILHESEHGPRLGLKIDKLNNP